MLKSRFNALIVMVFLAGLLAGCAGISSGGNTAAVSEAAPDNEQAMVCQKLESRTGSRMARTVCVPADEGKKDQDHDNAGGGDAQQVRGPA